MMRSLAFALSRRPEACRSLAHEIGVALIVKAAALAVLYLSFFTPSHRIQVTADRAAQAILNAEPAVRSD
jgi:hypothetical protein